MTALWTLWVLSLLLMAVFLFRGYRRLHALSPVTYEFHWHPTLFLSTHLRPAIDRTVARLKEYGKNILHRAFHALFHTLKRFHDRAFGKRVIVESPPPSFFLKSIAEHKKENISEERKNGL